MRRQFSLPAEVHQSPCREAWLVQMSEQIVETTEMPIEGLVELQSTQNDEQSPAMNQDMANDPSGMLDLLRDRHILMIYHDGPL